MSAQEILDKYLEHQAIGEARDRLRVERTYSDRDRDTAVARINTERAALDARETTFFVDHADALLDDVDDAEIVIFDGIARDATRLVAAGLFSAPAELDRTSPDLRRSVRLIACAVQDLDELAGLMRRVGHHVETRRRDGWSSVLQRAGHRVSPITFRAVVMASTEDRFLLHRPLYGWNYRTDANAGHTQPQHISIGAGR